MGSSIPSCAPALPGAGELNPGTVCWLNQVKLTQWKVIQARGDGTDGLGVGEQGMCETGMGDGCRDPWWVLIPLGITGMLQD